MKAPYYLLFGSEERESFCENIGFIGQQLDLFLSENGIGSCSLGASKPQDSKPKEALSLPYVIAMSFGKPAEPLHRSLSEFKRKSLTTISEGDDERLEAARLAPSAMNSQNWYFVADNGKIHCYRKKPNLMIGFMLNKMNQVDMGIAICHIARESEAFRFEKVENATVRKGYIYAGTVL